MKDYEGNLAASHRVPAKPFPAAPVNRINS